MDYDVMYKPAIAREFLGRAEDNDNEIIAAGFDPAQIQDLMIDLIEGVYGDGMFNTENCLKIPQNATTLNAPVVLLKNLILDGKLVHNGNPYLRWCLQNCFEFPAKYNKMITIGKENKDSPRRIDGAAAVVIALALIDRLKNTQSDLQKAISNPNFRFN